MILSEEEKEEVLKNMYGASWKELLKIKQNEVKNIPPHIMEFFKKLSKDSKELKYFAEKANKIPKSFLDMTKNIGKLLERKLLILDNKIPENIKESIKYWAEKNWIIVLDLPYREIQNLFFSKSNDFEKDSCYLMEKVKENLKNREINEKILKSSFFKNNAYNSVMECNKNKNYYAGVMVLSTMIDGALIKIQEKKENRKKIGKNIVKEIENKIDEAWSLEYILDYSLIIWLEKFFKNVDDFSNKKLNRNMLLHGMYEKEITELEFFQLLNVVHNMVERLDDWKEKMI